MKTSASIVIAAVVLAGCGGDGDPSSDASPCEVPVDGSPVELSVMWAGGWDPEASNARIAQFDESEPAIEVTIDGTAGFFPPAVKMLGDDAPVLGEVSYAMVPALAEAGAIQPIGRCLGSAGVDLTLMPNAARSKGEYAGSTYGVSTNIDTTLLLYDRAAFARAGLDPDAPPATLHDVLTFGRVLRDRAGIEHPVAWDQPQLALVGLDIASSDARDAAAAWVALAEDDLLLGPTDGGLPPVGSGKAAMQWIDPPQLWAYSSAIADGQAPAADLGVAPLPGLRDAVSGFGGGEWVVSASATPAQAAAAMRFLAWYQQPAQQSKFHITTDMYPSTLRAQETRELKSYWETNPLVGQGWLALQARPLALTGWERVLGSFGTIIPRLRAVAFDGASFDEEWPAIVDALARFEERQSTDARALIRCLDANIERDGFDVRECADV